MATIVSICRYISTVLVVVTLCTLPTCVPGKTRKLNSKNNPKGMRIIKIFHKRYSRKLENARTLEEFIKVFEKNENVEKSIQDLLLDQTLPDQRGNVQRLQRVQNELNGENITQLARRQMQEQMSAIECREPKPVMLNTYDVMGLTKGYLQYLMPTCIQVNRCGEHSGCCIEGESCKVVPGHVRNVTRQVVIVSVYIESTAKKGRTAAKEMRTLQVEEHTRCQCKQSHTRNCGDVRCPGFKTKDPLTCRCSCPKRCPIPYVPNPDTCRCECGFDSTPEGRRCRKIFRGKGNISENECRCVRATQCNVPACRSRYHFNNTTCDCTRNESIERIVDEIDSYGGIFEADLPVRSRNHIPASELSSDKENVLPEAVVGSMAVSMVRSSMQRSGPDGAKHTKLDPKLGGMSPEATEYRHSSHTSYNDTQSVHTKYNSSGLTKAKITVWEKSSDDLNATNIKDKTRVSLKPNGTEHQTIFTQKSANLGPLPNSLPHLSEKPPEEDDTNLINAHVLGEDDLMVTMDTGESVGYYDLSSSEYISSYSSFDRQDKVEKQEDILDLFSYEVENEDLETYKFAESSGDYKFGGY
ncbi:Vascular endothelial growth factor A [Holothuria leucospilota]|uniref:Vascular endothelial growth factor A n=1 Tax=Holothuria leucospilota TaxID=206669 RepID=A0A9Q1BJV0_HOLLE|nr:Vascular endothelial growth factor A [Holothuria leucospilota]